MLRKATTIAAASAFLLLAGGTASAADLGGIQTEAETASKTVSTAVDATKAYLRLDGVQYKQTTRYNIQIVKGSSDAVETIPDSIYEYKVGEVGDRAARETNWIAGTGQRLHIVETSLKSGDTDTLYINWGGLRLLLIEELPLEEIAVIDTNAANAGITPGTYIAVGDGELNLRGPGRGTPALPDTLGITLSSLIKPQDLMCWPGSKCMEYSATKQADENSATYTFTSDQTWPITLDGAKVSNLGAIYTLTKSQTPTVAGITSQISGKTISQMQLEVGAQTINIPASVPVALLGIPAPPEKPYIERASESVSKLIAAQSAFDQIPATSKKFNAEPIKLDLPTGVKITGLPDGKTATKYVWVTSKTAQCRLELSDEIGGSAKITCKNLKPKS